MFTCNTCSLEFPTAGDQRSHMKSDWHRYNLKRRVAQLPSLEEDVFNSKVAALTLDDNEDTLTKKKGEKQITKKEQRRKEKEALQEQKRQLLDQARKSMMAKINSGEISAEELSKLQAKPETPEPEAEAKPESTGLVSPTGESPDPETPELTPEQQDEKLIQQKLANKIEIKPTTCLFSHPKENKNFDTVEENIEHMFKAYGLYIPEASYLVDKAGLINYLGEKISFGFCIACNYQGKNAEAAREHMRTKRHRRIPYETEDEKLEISEFYDFSSTYDDVEAVVLSEGVQEDGEEWEDVEGEEGSGDDSDEEYVPPVKDAIYQDGHELVLPSGTVLGHRSMARYYRQNLPPDRVLSEGQGTVIAAETRHMLTLKDRQELASKKRAWGKEKKREDVNDRRAQKFINNQPHFRDQLLQ